MSNLKNLVAKANSGLSLHSSSKERFGLDSFIAASTNQLLMTRGGYGNRFTGYTPAGWWGSSSGGGSGPGGILGSNYTVGSPQQHHTASPSSGSTSTSRIPGYWNIAVKKTVEWFAPDNIIGLGGKILGYMFTIGEVGRGSSKTDNPNYPKSVPLKE